MNGIKKNLFIINEDSCKLSSLQDELCVYV